MTADAYEDISCPPPVGRECDCPSWVVRCVHFEGRTVVLCDADANINTHQACVDAVLYRALVPKGRFFVNLVDGPELSNCECRVPSLKPTKGAPVHEFAAEAEALAAFEREKLRLLGREVAL